MTRDELLIEEAAFEFARLNRSALARRIADTNIFPPEDYPITVFMAGSPGAGKTEISKALVEIIEEGDNDVQARRVLRIDPDDFRVLIPGYNGSNSFLFQRAVTKILEKVLDRAFEKRISFILDGTLANINVARRNIDRVLGNRLAAQIMYVYQRPELAWKFVRAREITEGRNIPMDEFVKQYLAARRNIVEIRRSYGESLIVNLLVKNTDGTDGAYEGDVTADQIDDLIPETYDHIELIELLTEAEKNECS
ncbi:zeta toxin family protein [Pseudomonas sp. A34-9]|uniref:zeta toxin family protein n=1 Tax=Pseudomonas sp. A34-9 TaxID=3034675 RepID=UPI00240E4CBF|nr:zeta toxin family protein [Pseudomonas sp. A34-9]